MPYDTLNGLPESVWENLPHHTREICRAACVSAEKSRAQRVARSTVESKYDKNRTATGRRRRRPPSFS